MTLIVDRHLVGKISPGTRVTAIGIYSIYQVRHTYVGVYCSHRSAGPSVAHAQATT